MNSETSVAILLTVFNRKDLTLKCLNQLKNMHLGFDAYLVDDGSTDGTAEEIKVLYPSVTIVKGTGDLFWNRGMHVAWETAASAADYDFYLWMNDDVVLHTDAINELFACSELQRNQVIITGIVSDASGAKTLYGGSDKQKHKVAPNGKLQAVHYLNGNVVLIPKHVYRQLGNLDKCYHHDLGDVDYGLRAQKAGIGVFTTRKFVATGTPNSISRLRKNKSSLRGRFKRLYSPLGSPPKINFYFRRKHKGLMNAFVYWIFLHFINIIPDSLNELLFKNKYQ